MPPETGCVAVFQRKARGPRCRPVSPGLRAPSGCAQRYGCEGRQGTFPAARARRVLRCRQRRSERGCSSLKLHPQKDPLSAVDWGHTMGGKLELKIVPFCLFHYWDLSKDFCRSFFCPTYWLHAVSSQVLQIVCLSHPRPLPSHPPPALDYIYRRWPSRGLPVFLSNRSMHSMYPLQIVCRSL